MWKQLWVALLMSVLSTGHADTKRAKENNQNKYRVFLPPYTETQRGIGNQPSTFTGYTYTTPKTESDGYVYRTPDVTISTTTSTKKPDGYVYKIPELIPLKPHIKRRNALQPSENEAPSVTRSAYTRPPPPPLTRPPYVPPPHPNRPPYVPPPPPPPPSTRPPYVALHPTRLPYVPRPPPPLTTPPPLSGPPPYVPPIIPLKPHISIKRRNAL